MKAIGVFLLAALLLGGGLTSSQKPILSPFDTMKYDRVVAYDYEGGETGRQIVKNGELIKRDTLSKRGIGTIYHQKELSQAQITRFNNTIGDTASYGLGAASCFTPRLGFVYYRKGKIVGHISICFECNYLVSTPAIPAVYSVANRRNGINIGDWRKGNTEKDYKPFWGFSLSGMEKLSGLCKELKFYRCGADTASLRHILYMK